MGNVRLNVLVIDDNQKERENIFTLVLGLGHNPTMAPSGMAALSMAVEKLKQFDMAIIDQRMPEMDGFETAQELLAINPQLLPVMLTAFKDLDHAVKACQLDFVDYLGKPVVPETIKKCFQSPKISKMINFKKFLQENSLEISKKCNFFGESEGSRILKKYIEKAAGNDANLLVTGESGTGKEMVARLVHHLSRRSKKDFVPLNCSAIPEGLIESELFGHRKGAFNNALADRPGAFEAANGGTVFLDEVGDMPLEQQVKLLRVLEEKAIKRLGENRERDVDFRLVAATNKDLEKAVNEGKFREDLYFRLNLLTIEVPPLRERREDIPGLVDFVLKQLGGGIAGTIPEEILERIYSYHWPGNIRQLQNHIQRGYYNDDWTEILRGMAEAPSCPRFPSAAQTTGDNSAPAGGQYADEGEAFNGGGCVLPAVAGSTEQFGAARDELEFFLVALQKAMAEDGRATRDNIAKHFGILKHGETPVTRVNPRTGETFMASFVDKQMQGQALTTIFNKNGDKYVWLIAHEFPKYGSLLAAATFKNLYMKKHEDLSLPGLKALQAAG